MAKSIRIVPAILTDNAATLETLVRQTGTFTDYAQFDMMDGHFVPPVVSPHRSRQTKDQL